VYRNQLLGVWLVTFLMTFSGASAAQQSWSTVLATPRGANWTIAGAGPIPARPSPASNCASLSPGVTAAQIDAAIVACPSGGVVFLNAGTYNLSTGINFQNSSNVTLRGAGANQTILKFAAYDGCGGAFAGVCLNNGHNEYSAGYDFSANWTAGYTQGATQITLDNTSNVKVGELMFIDQLEDTSDTGDVYQGQQQWSCVSCANPGRPNRGQFQTVKVTAVNGSVVTITPGLYWPNWRASQSPQAWWSAGLPITGAGVEDLTLDGSAQSSTGGGLVVFYNAINSWVKGVRTIDPKDSHIKMWYGNLFDTIRDSYFYGTQSHGGSSTQSYGFDGYTGSANLVENNIFDSISTPIQMEGQQGTVLGYNYIPMTLNFCSPTPCFDWLLGTSSMHAPGNGYMLFEGNQNVEMILDTIHGPADFISMFRNRVTGWQVGGGEQTVPIYNFAWSRYTNAIGNVLGTSGYHTRYTTITGDGSSNQLCWHSIYSFGISGGCYTASNGGGNLADDPLVGTTAMRWGNYDTVNGATRFVNGEVPSGLAKYSNPIPSSQALPPSFYLSSKPVWFGSVPFPPVGPDVTGGDIANVGGFAYNIPSQHAFLNTPVDQSYATATGVSTASWSGGTATVTLGSYATNVVPATSITITGMTPAAYNCQHCTVTGSTGTTVSYTVSSNPGGAGSGGTAYWPDILAFNENIYYGGSQTGPTAPSGLTAIVQ
jgi:hypothetical protein